MDGKNLVSDVSIHVRKGEIYGLLGPNGAGKSTTFKLILGLIDPDAGSIQVMGKPVEKLGRRDKEKTGVVLADSGFSGYLMIRDIIPIMAATYHRFDKEDFVKKCKQNLFPT